MELRETDFKNDVVTYGTIGENDLYNIINQSSKKKFVENISEDTRFKEFDIDIIQYNVEGITRDDVLRNLRNGIADNEQHYILYEAKTDTYGLKTGNMDYEYYDCSSHKVGCAARSKCDYFYYVFVDKQLNIRRRFLMRMDKLRKYIDDRKKFPENKLFRTHYMTKKSGDKTENYLINVEELKKHHIAKEL